MSGSQLQFYRARVEQARAEGEAATLEHVRERLQYLGFSFPRPRHRAPDHESCGSARRSSLRFAILKST